MMSNTQFVFRQELLARKWPLGIMAVLFAMGVAFLSSTQVGGSAQVDFLWLIFALFVSVFYLALSRLKIIIDNNGLEMQMLFRKEQLQWDSVITSKLSFEFSGRTADVKWIIAKNDGKPFSFSPTFFSREQLRQVATALVNKSASAQISPKIQNMAEGNFPWYIF